MVSGSPAGRKKGLDRGKDHRTGQDERVSR